MINDFKYYRVTTCLSINHYTAVGHGSTFLQGETVCKQSIWHRIIKVVATTLKIHIAVGSCWNSLLFPNLMMLMVHFVKYHPKQNYTHLCALKSTH